MVGDKFVVGSGLVNLASLANQQGQFEESGHYAEEALSIFQWIGDETQQPFPLRLMGYAAIHAGNLVRAQVLMRESLIGNVNLQNLREQLACLVGIAYCTLVEEGCEQAVRLCALADLHRRANAFHFHQPDEVALETALKECKRRLGKSRYKSSYKQGETLDLGSTLASLMKE